MQTQWLLRFFIVFSCFFFIFPVSNKKLQTQVAPSRADQFPFERIIWTYWNSGSTQTPIIVQLCIQNLEVVAKKHNFTFNLVNESNVRNYIHNYQELFVEVRKKSIQRSFTHAADLLRMLIIEQNGGIWVDTTTIFLNGLTEIQNIMSQQYQHLVVNRFSKRPDVMFFYYSVGQNRIQEKIPDPNDPTKTILYNEYPDYEIWSIFAKKNSSFISEVRKTYSQFTVTQFLQSQQRFISEDIYINDIDNNRDYLYLNMAVAYTLQKKQLELDQNLELFGQRKFAFEFFNLWGLHSQYGPMLTTREDLIPYDYLFWYSKQDLENMGFKFRFFMKQFGYIRYVTGKKFNLTLKTFHNNNLTFEEFIVTNPDKLTCDEITFVVQNSIMSNLLTNSTVLQKHRIPIITKHQNTQWLEYCSKNDSFFQQISKKFKPFRQTMSLYKGFYYKVHKAKAESILYENEDLTLNEWIRIKFNDNFFLFYEFGYMLIMTTILFVTHKVIKFFVQRAQKYTNICFTTKANNEHKQIQNFALNSQSPKNQIQKEQKNEKLIYLFIFCLLVLNFFMYNATDVICGRQQPEAIFVCIFISFLVQAFIEKQIQESEKIGKQINTAKYSYELFYMMINYMVAFLCLTHVWRNRFWLNWFAQVLGMIGPCISKLQKILNQNDEHQIVVSNQKYHTQKSIADKIVNFLKENPRRSAILTFLFSTIVLKNLRYMAGSFGYYIKFFTIIPFIDFITCFLYTSVRCIAKNLWTEVIRLGFLIIMSIKLYLTIDQIDTLVQKFPRISFISMTIVTMSLIYLQIGIRLQKRPFRIPKFTTGISPKFIEWIVLIIPLWIEFFVGLYWFNHSTMESSFKDYALHYVFFVYSCFFTAVLLKFNRKKLEEENSITPIKTFEFESYEEEYEQVNDK